MTSHTNPTDGPERAAVRGLFVNALLAAAKLVAGIVGHSSALVADSVESLVDIAGSVVVWRALRWGAQPPDERHPFGHGKAEPLAALAVGLLVIVAGLGIGAASIHGVTTPQEVPSAYTLLVLAVVVPIKEVMFRMTRRAANSSGSSAGFADAWHHRSDAITSAAAFVGISIAVMGGPRYAAADDWAALVASVVILFNGVLLMRAPLSELMDVAAPAIAEQCSALVRQVDGIRAIEQCEARKVGRSYRVIMHVEVDPAMSVADAHALTGKAKTLMRQHLPEVASLLIHVEPHRARE